MHRLHSLLLLLLFSFDVLSAPTSRPQRKGRSFKVDRVRRNTTPYIHGPTALRKAYLKYGIVATDLGIDLLDFEPIIVNVSASTSSSADEPEETGAVSATSVEGDSEFVSPVSIGGQRIVMDFDTGSADLWVMNSKLPTSDQKGHDIFDSSKSSTWKEMEGSTFKVSYGDSSYASGGVGTDTVDIGGATVKNQAIGLPNKVSSSFTSDAHSNGLVGLGFSSINTVSPTKQKTFFENVAEDLEVPVLTSLLKSDGVGEYEFGIIDESKYQGDMINVTIDSSNGYWEFKSEHFVVGDGDLQDISQTPTAIADTGTSLMLVSPEVVDAYYKKVDGALYANTAGGYVYPCKADMPDFSIAVGTEHLATIPGSLMSFSQVGTNTTTGDTLCYGGIQSNQGAGMQVLGDVFLKALFVVFDMRGPSLGLASPVQ